MMLQSMLLKSVVMAALLGMLCVCLFRGVISMINVVLLFWLVFCSMQLSWDARHCGCNTHQYFFS